MTGDEANAEFLRLMSEHHAVACTWRSTQRDASATAGRGARHRIAHNQEREVRSTGVGERARHHLYGA